MISGVGGDPVKPTCAIIVDAGGAKTVADAASLLEVKLSAEPTLRLIDRSQIDQAVHEQELSVLLGADGGGQRTRMGRLLKADMLVVLHAQPGGVATMTLGVSETRTGLRLLTQQLDLSDHAEERVNAAAALVVQAARRIGQPTRTVVAVPPFVSQDLTFEYDQLKSAYARLVEQALLAQPGVIVVDLQEAQAIAREARVAGGSGGSGGAGVERPLPLYVLGEYRNDGHGLEHRVTLHLIVKRGQEELASQSTEQLTPTAAAQWLRESSAKMIASGATDSPDKQNPIAEKQQLVQRSQEFMRLGALEEAAQLTEAAVLLDPTDLRLRFQAMRLALEVFPATAKRPGDAVRFWFDVEPHFEYVLWHELIDKADPDWMTYRDLPYVVLGRLLRETKLSSAEEDWNWAGTQATATRDILFESRRHLRDLLVERLEERKPASHFEIFFARVVVGTVQMPPSFYNETEEANWSYHLRAIDALGDMWHISELVGRDLMDSKRNEASWRNYMTQAAAIPNAAVHEEAMKRLFPPKATQPAAPPPVFAGTARWVKISLHLVGEHPKRFQVDQWLACGNGVDLLRCDATIYVMRRRGVIEPLHLLKANGQQDMMWTKGPELIAFDGRYAWINFPPADTAPNDSPQEHPSILVALDPATGQSIEITSQQGLPPATLGLTLVPIAPGWVCGVGAVGSERRHPHTWIANIRVDDKAPRAEVFFEARKRPLENEANASDPGYGFDPGRAFPVIDQASGKVLVYAVRDVWNTTRYPQGWRWKTEDGKEVSRGAGPLLIDPMKRQVRVLEDFHDAPVLMLRSPVVGLDGAVYWFGDPPQKTDAATRTPVWQFGFPELKAIRIDKPQPGLLGTLSSDGRFYRVKDERLYISAGLDQPWRPLDGWPADAPVRTLVSSRQFGLVALGHGSPWRIEVIPNEDPRNIAVTTQP